MYIERIILDGFKSYATKTELKDFDPQFNAITGFNGSGKSNIFDAICFVMGLSKLKHVRVSNLTGLIYKSGQAQITKASVSIVFNNSDTSKSPSAYKDSKQITVTRQITVSKKNKYIINGKTATQAKVQDLFESVHLNINNPHFMVMQGKITKILGMKPIEVLGMIQEAAGTSTYERHKEKCLKKIKNKEKKLDEIENILNTQIAPALRRAEADRKKHARLSTVRERIAILRGNLQKIQYKDAQEYVEFYERFKVKSTKLIEELNEERGRVDSKMTRLDQELKAAKQQRGIDEKLKHAEEALKQLETQLIAARSNTKHSSETLEEEKSALASSQSELKGKNHEVQQLQRNLQHYKLALESKADEVKQWKNRSINLQKALNGQGSGASTNSTNELMECNTNISTANGQIRVLTNKIENIQSQIQEKEHQVVNSKQSHEQTQQQLEQLQRELDHLEKEKNDSSFSMSDFVHLEGERHSVESKLKQARHAIDNLSRTDQTIRNARDWEKRVGREIKGTLVSLFDTNDKKYNLALSVFLSSTLGRVVVDTDKTGGQLVKEASRNKRYISVMPMNQLRPRRLNKSVIDAARAEGAHLAIDLIKFDPELQKVMETSFGSFFVCENASIAERVCNNRKINVSAVSLDGSVYRPGGTLSGGHYNTSADSITSMKSYKDARAKFDSLKQQLRQVDERLQAMSQQKRKYKELENKIEVKKHELHSLKTSFSMSSYENLSSQIENLKSELEDCKRRLETFQHKKKSNQERAEQLKSEIEALESGVADRESTKKQLKDAKRKFELVQKDYDSTSEKVNTTEAEIMECEDDIESLKNKIAQSETNIQNLQKAFESASQELKQYQEQHTEHERAVMKRKQEIEDSEKESLMKQEKLDSLRTTKLDIETRLKQQKSKARQKAETLTSFEATMRKIEEENPDIKIQVQSLTEDLSEKTVREEIEKLKQEDEELSSNMSDNPKDYEANKKKHSELLEKKEKIITDRIGIQESIQEWDDAKIKAINTTFTAVNRDFGDIFSDLLPNTRAKLVLTNPDDIMAGIEFRVAFGNVWKESLTELSGGQKSLLGLSLILAFLRSRPAPLYILDEIDAALDPSHTQNIGTMLKNRFKNSQFLIISLKQGMFQNANVIFRTSLNQGQSSVQRTANTDQIDEDLRRELEKQDRANRAQAERELQGNTSLGDSKKKSKKRKRTQ